jgi:hydroxypyruvate reductase
LIVSPEKFITSSIRFSPYKDKICQLLSDVIHRADAGLLVKKSMEINSGMLEIQGEEFNLDRYHRIFIIGAGKAVVPMSEAVSELICERITTGLVITKDEYISRRPPANEYRIKVMEAAHPVPELRNISATREMLSLVSDLNHDDLVFCLISGGGSSLLTKPSRGLSLRDIQATTAALLKCGASIEEMNIVRKHLDDVKGGGLVQHINHATVISLILSDVIGDNLDIIASGPTVPDPSTFDDAWAVLSKYQVIYQIPSQVLAHLSAGRTGQIPDTLKPGDTHFAHTSNFLIGNNPQVVSAAIEAAHELDFYPQLLPISLNGESRYVGQAIANHLKSNSRLDRASGMPNCFITGGETIVTVKGNGKGGRNQELALGAVKNLSGSDRMVLVSLATDGGDGPTDAAGAVVTNQTYSLGLAQGLDPEDYLENNDSYHYFDQLGDLLKTGPTLTNVNDLVFAFTG